jgi:hypothetical protein
MIESTKTQDPYPIIERISLAEGPFTSTRAWVNEAPTIVRVFDFNATSGVWTSEYVTEYGTGRFTTKRVASQSLAKLLADALESERSYRFATTREGDEYDRCDRCGERFRENDERAEVAGELTSDVIHAGCFQRGTDVLA